MSDDNPHLPSERDSPQGAMSIPKDPNERMHDKIARMRENFADEDDFLSPIGSPTEMSFMGGRDKFMKLKRKLEDDQALSQINDTLEGDNPPDADVNSFLDNLRNNSRSFNVSNVYSGSINLPGAGSSSRIENHPKFVQMYEDLKNRDKTIIDLERKMMECDRIVMELKDTIQQKEKMIGSKHEAASVIQNKCQKEIDNIEGELKHTQKTLFDMERNFSSAQDSWKSEKERLNLEIQQQFEKIKQLEAGNFEMVTATAAVQEAMVILADQQKQVLRELEQKHSKELKAKDSQLNDMEAKFKNEVEEKESKLKELERSRQLEIDSLEERIQELEISVAQETRDKEDAIQMMGDLHKNEMDSKDSKLDMLEELVNKQEDEYLQKISDKDNLLKEAIEKHSEEMSLKDSKIEEMDELLSRQEEDFMSQLEEKDNKLTEALKASTEEVEQKDAKIKELSDSVDKAKAVIQKLKLRYQSTVSALKESNEKNNEAVLNAKIVSLENHIAELEEEKGNLLLHLVDFDELQAGNSKIVDELEDYKKSHLLQTEEIFTLKESVANLHKQVVLAEYASNEKHAEIARLELEVSSMVEAKNDERINFQLSVAAAEEPFGFDGLLEEVEKLREYKQKYEQSLAQLDSLAQDKSSCDENLVYKDATISQLSMQIEELQMIQASEESSKKDYEAVLNSLNEKLQFASQKEEIMLKQYDELTRESQEQLTALQEEIKMRDIAMAQFKSDISSYEEATRLAQDQVLALETQLQAKEELIKTKNEELTKLCDDLERSNAPLVEETITQTKVDQQLSSAPNQNQPSYDYNEYAMLQYQYETDIQQAKQQIAELQEALKLRDTTLSEYMSDIQRYDEATRLAQEQVAGLQEAIQGRDNFINQKNNEVAELTARIAEIQEEIFIKNYAVKNAEEAVMKNDQLANDLTNSNNLIKQNEETIVSLENKLKDMQDRIKYLESTNEEISSDIASRIANEEIRIASYEARLNEREAFISNLKTEKDEYIKGIKEENEQILSLLSDKNDNINELMTSCSDLKFLFEEKAEELNACVARKEEEIQIAVQQYDAQTKQAQEQLINMQMDIQARDELLARQKTEINIYSEQNIHAQEQIISLQMDIQSRDELLTQKTNEIADLSHQLNESRNKLTVHCQQLEERADVATAYWTQASEELAKAQELISYLKQDIEKKDEILLQQGREIEYSRGQAHEHVNAHQTDLNRKEEELKQLQLEVNSMGEQVKQTSEQMVLLQLDIMTRDDRLNEKDIEINHLMSKICEFENAQAAHLQLIQQSHEYRNTIENLSREVEKYKQAVDESEKVRKTCAQLELRLAAVQEDESKLVPVVEPEIVKTTAYLTYQGEPDPSPVGPSQEALEEERQKQLNEIRELKVRNGKMMQKFKQLKDRYEAVVKEKDSLKTKNDLSLDSAMQDELLGQVKKHECVIEEKAKLIGELQAEKDRLLQKVDIMERANDKLTEVKDYQDRILEDLTQHKKQLEQEISGLKWRLDEVVSNASAAVYSEMPFVAEQSLPANEARDDAAIIALRQQNAALVQELEAVQHEMLEEVSRLNARIQELEAESKELPPREECDGESTARTPIQTPLPQVPASNFSSQDLGMGDQGQDAVDSTNSKAGFTQDSILPTNEEIFSLKVQLQKETAEKIILERKIELLQEKISEIESSEMKCYEENMALRSYSRRLEMDNLNHLTRWEEIKYSEGSMSSMKEKALHGEVMRFVEALQSRDHRCEELTLEIARLVEERDGLQLKLSEVLKHNVNLYEEANKGQEPSGIDAPLFDKEALKMKLAELEQTNFNINMDLKRERKARHLMQEQLFFSQASRVLIRGSGVETLPNPPPSPQWPVTPVRTPYGSPTHSPPQQPSASPSPPTGGNVQPRSLELSPQPKSPVSNVQTNETEPSSSVKHI